MKHKYFLIFLISLTSFPSLECYAQIGGQVSYIYPNRKTEFGFITKPTVGILFKIGSDEIDAKFRYGGYVGIFPFKTRQDSMLTTAYYDGQILEAYETFKDNRFYLFPFFVSFEYKFFDTKISPFIGTDIGAHLINFRSTYIVPWRGSNEIEEYISITWDIAPKIGLEYNYDDEIAFQIGMKKNITILGYEPLSYVEGYLSIIYYFY